jgi:hypothetical protein
MRARPQIRDVLVAKKLRRWLLIAHHPFVDRSCPPSRARRNYWRLLAKHSELANRLGLSITSVYTLKMESSGLPSIGKRRGDQGISSC